MWYGLKLELEKVNKYFKQSGEKKRFDSELFSPQCCTMTFHSEKIINFLANFFWAAPIKFKNYLLAYYIALITPSFSIKFSDSRIPAVSYSIIGYPFISSETDKISLVVPGISETIAISLFAKWFNNELFPTFGLPWKIVLKIIYLILFFIFFSYSKFLIILKINFLIIIYFNYNNCYF